MANPEVKEGRKRLPLVNSKSQDRTSEKVKCLLSGLSIFLNVVVVCICKRVKVCSSSLFVWCSYL